MSTSMTTERIIRHIENDTIPGEWEWESALESACNDSCQDAADGARFLEKLQPGHIWSAAEYNGLMYHHFSGRWSSVEEIAYLRAGEKHEDDVDAADGDPFKVRQADELHAQRTADDRAAVQFLRSTPGTHVFDCADGTVLTFDGIVNGVIKEEEPA